MSVSANIEREQGYEHGFYGESTCRKAMDGYIEEQPGRNGTGWRACLEIPGFMGIDELTWLYERACEMESVVEVGSWKGRTTYALASGCRGQVYAIDHFLGSEEYQAAKDRGVPCYEENLFKRFTEACGHFDNLTLLPMSSERAASNGGVPAEVDMVFIDGGHNYDTVWKDLCLWYPRTRKLFCGHDFDMWGVCGAVVTFFGRENITLAPGTNIWVAA